MKIRKVEPGDVNQIEEIFDLYWSDSFRLNLSQKLQGFISESPILQNQHFCFLVAEENSEILGVAAYRDVQKHMLEFTSTEKPAEFYVAAVREINRGVGTLLRQARIKELQEQGYTEILFFSGEKHQSSWKFHDDSDFKRVAEMNAPNGEKGHVWRMELK